MATSPGLPVVMLEEAACYCCGESVDANSLVRFGCHPHDGVCAGCAGWLHERGLALGRNNNRPVWRRLGPGRWWRGGYR